ncbi:PAS domain S-box protein [Balneolaceae bacterium YR4-1]|uniref:histidine kinase n=2 Tax=Halalkalibaculum roseum TaxID=2709311 RepID=A0A6M1SPS2_9BACT|nr:PAS domain S-box protein [Halalkalibaculum roseum]
MFIYDLDSNKIRKANDAAFRVYGYDEDEMIGLSIAKLGEKEDSLFSINSSTGFEDNLFESKPIRHKDKDGNSFKVKISYQDLEKEKDSARLRLVVIHDITRKRNISEQGKAYDELNHLIQNSPLAMVRWDKNFRIEEWSDRAEEMTGFKKEEVVGKTPYIFDFYNVKDIFRIAKKIQGFLNGSNDRDQFETKIYTKDRSIIDIKIHGSAIRDESGKLVSVLTFIEDYSQHKKVEERYRQLFESATDGICILKDNKIIDCNSKLEKIFGAARDKIIGRTPIDFSPEKQPDGSDSAEKGFGKINLALQGTPQQFSWKHKTWDGKLVDSEVNLNRVEINNEMHIQAIVRDMTKQKENERKIALRGELFTQLFQNSPIGIVMMNNENKVTMANAAFEEMFGYSFEELEGKNVDDLIVSRNKKGEAEHITDATHHGKQFNMESVRIAKDGTPLDVIIGGIPVYNEGKQVAIYGMYVDITERKSSEKLLQRSLKEKEILLAEVHHRVKNNLAIVSGLLQLQTFNVEEDEQLKKHLQDSQLRIHSMAIVHEMLYQSETLSEIEVSRYMTKLGEVVSDTLQPDNKNIEVTTDADEIMLNVNQAIPCALIVNELITNAFEYAFEGKQKGNIRINVHQQGKKILTEVRDDGIGLPKDFDKKKQNSLGIYLVNTLGEQLEADVDVDSGDWGTSFSFSFAKSDKPGSSSSHKIHRDGVQRQELMAE